MRADKPMAPTRRRPPTMRHQTDPMYSITVGFYSYFYLLVIENKLYSIRNVKNIIITVLFKTSQQPMYVTNVLTIKTISKLFFVFFYLNFSK